MSFTDAFGSDAPTFEELVTTSDFQPGPITVPGTATTGSFGSFGGETLEQRIARNTQLVLSGSRDLNSIRTSLGRPASTSGVDQRIIATGDPAALEARVRQIFLNAGAGDIAAPQSQTIQPTAEQRDAFGVLANALNQFGLGSLGQWAWDQIVSGRSNAEILIELRNRGEYKQRFPAMEIRRKAGLPAMSEAEYLNYEAQARSLFRAYGIPVGFYDQPEDIAQFLGANVGLPELNARVQDGFAAAMSAPPEVREALRRFYGVTDGALAAFFLDPDRAMPVIERQFVAAQLGGASARTGFGDLSVQEGERLAELGVTVPQAQEGFGILGRSRELFGVLPGQGAAESTIGREAQLGAVFEGDVAAQEQIERQRRRRQSLFEGGGAFAESRQGFEGIGSAS